MDNVRAAPTLSFGAYAVASSMVAAATIAYAVHTRQQFYPTVR